MVPYADVAGQVTDCDSSEEFAEKVRKEGAKDVTFKSFPGFFVSLALLQRGSAVMSVLIGGFRSHPQHEMHNEVSPRSGRSASAHL